MKVLVVGSGIAGLTTALRAEALGHDVELVVKGAIGSGCTPLAQGGIAGAYGPDDSPALHALDTMHAGDGHGDPRAIAALVDGAAAAVEALIDAGVAFDRGDDGEIARGLEAAHSLPRIAHAGGDATGAAISAALIDRVRASGIHIREHAFAADLLVTDERAHGIRLLDRTVLAADAVVLATGGAGQLYAHTTNPAGATGDGIAMALRAGAAVADLEFVQFHPTVLESSGVPFLISEAVRGAGAVLVDADGHRFLLDQHPDAELAPRDVVARAVTRQAAAQGSPVRLDATALGAAALAHRFPTIDAELRRRGLDWSREPVPVTPAAHYLMGGIATDLDGRTSMPGLWAVGETARTGVHGANRLASNSLLEGAVFAARAADSLGDTPPHASRSRSLSPSSADSDNDRDLDGTTPFTRADLQQLMWDGVGLLRTHDGMSDAVAQLSAWAAPAGTTATAQEDANLLTVARAVASAALARTTSLGAHHLSHAPAPALIGAS
ncbi:L-aspartate oxidase [Microbacterium sp. H1-D42]|uniref:L-aspartate oxidase n=1 Tax=Microbacterium sp. H1-D42 TaxID=2925844 RepID=UPI001F52D038|nr:L-aspartate oxidase [Microbacterium sp. H1-D42]UNK69818.1 L-aspartate oxidase [Microbacterium sp. H1-D42]